MSSNKEIYDGYKFKDKLLPCPFCGGVTDDGRYESPFMSYNSKDKNFNPHYTIMCGNCGAEPNRYVKTELEAIAVWNRRLPMTRKVCAISTFNVVKEILKKEIDELEVEKIINVITRE
jgi:hypothetical protein